jgi:glutathione synthase/RimK-type ligase-like ATP-grasp enzyme
VTSRSGQSVLIITSKFDPHSDHVIGILKTRSISFFRLNTDDFHDDYTVSAHDRPFEVLFRDAWGRTHSFPAETRAVWHRKPVEPALPTTIVDDAARTIVLQETNEFLTYPSSMDAARWINNPDANQRAQRKFPQLRLASALGLRVPRTLITNDPGRARDFQQEIDGPLICKSMKAQGFEEAGRPSFIFSRKVEAGEFRAHIDQIRHCPTFLQEYVEKDHELRVTIFGERVFACRIDSQAVPGAESDWRRIDPFKIPHRIVDLDPAVESALTAMLREAGLLYGAFDLVVTPRGEAVFLELNPNGQYLWIELITGAPLSQAMVELLAA